MLTVKRLPLGTMAANCYLVFESEKNRTLIIDPGDEADFIIKVVKERALVPVAILITHGHFDHFMAAGELKLSLGIEAWGSFKERELIDKMPRQAKKYTQSFQLPLKLDKNLKENDTLRLGKYRFLVLEVPGHTPGGIAFFCQKEKLVFGGDLLFSGGQTGRWDFPYSDKDRLLGSVAKILALPKDTKVYPGHGEEFLLKDLPSE